mgnify:CR=1 FL=1
MENSEGKIEDKNKSEEEFEQIKIGAWQGLKIFFSELLDIRQDTDRDATIEAVKKDISFKGHNAWILIFSIFVASIGLNVSSTAVVIGAMLISPLMGPIVGLGLSVAINDVITLRKSLINLGVMIALSVITAYLYFELSPLTKESPELIARTYPTILDVLIAIFGGLALIVAKTKKGTIASVIFGVAIATALMPPLCTVGYGLAIGNFHYAGGAFYLFSINAVFIALSTFIVAKLLRFPLVRYANSKRRKRIAQIATLIALIVMVPSVILFLNLLKVELFVNRASEFVEQNIKYDGAEVVKFTQNFEDKEINIYLIGSLVPKPIINTWKAELKETPALRDANLNIYQGSDTSNDLANRLSGELKFGILEDLYVKNEELLQNKDNRIDFLESELSKLKLKEIRFKEISKEVKINYNEIVKISYSNRISTNFTIIDTLPVINVEWNKTFPKDKRIENKEKLEEWLKYRLKMDTLLIIDNP